MKTLNEIRYFLFATIVLGCFANFAQNEYGLSMLYYSSLFISFIFFIEAFVFYSRTRSESKTKAIYLFAEHFLLGCIFLGTFFKWEFILPPGPFLVFGSLLLILLYFIYAIRMLIKESKKGLLLSLVLFLFIIATMSSVTGLAAKLQHFPGSRILMNISFYSVVFLLLIVILKRKYSYDGGSITLKDRVMKIPGKMPMVFMYFSIWILYISFVVFGIAPNFYTLSNPPAVEKLRASNNPKEQAYWDNYFEFLGNRNDIQYK